MLNTVTVSSLAINFDGKVTNRSIIIFHRIQITRHRKRLWNRPIDFKLRGDDI
jgi:hypothetical protein